MPRLVGHERIRALTGAALAAGRLPPSLLLSGPAGVGKRTFAVELSRALLCAAPSGIGPCGRCAACSRSGRGLHPDLMVVAPDGASVKIEQVRDLVREVMGRPFEAARRAFVVDEAHLMTEQAQNALLKSLEEPPPTSFLFLVTSQPQALLTTIRSRCQALRFGTLSRAALAAHLQEAVGLGPGEAALRAALGGGSVGAALTLDIDTYRAFREEWVAYLAAARPPGVLDRMAVADRLADSDDPVLALTTLRALLRDVAALRAGGAAERLLNPDLSGRLAALAGSSAGARAVEVAEAVGEARDAIEGKVSGTPLKMGAANRVLAFDLLLDRAAR